jgi:hypothetical protein
MPRPLFVAALSAALFVAAPMIAHAAEDEAPKKPAAKPGDLHSEMEAMNKAIRTLNKTITDANKKDANLAAVNDLEFHTIACKGIIPKGAATQPADVKDKYLAEYRKQMGEVLKTELELEQQVMAGDSAKAQETVKQLRQMEKDGHKIFQPPDEQSKD